MAEPAPSLQLQGLTQIFGPAPRAHLAAVMAGLGRDELRARHGHTLALRDVSLQLQGGAISVVMGLSGSGKSTLLRHLNRLIEPTAGRVLCGEVDVTALDAPGLRAFRQRSMAMVFQRFALLPHRTVLQNVGYALELQGVASAEREARARHWLARVGLAGHEQDWPATLSGGMQQRVGLARALAADAPVLLMDEAFSALDPLHRVDMQDLLLDLQRELRKTVVFITHDLDEALRLADHLVILRDGAVVQQGSATDIVLRPADAQVRRFVRDVNRGRVLRCAALAR
ncbi:MAG: ATP-binding cassette domain-containing protein, partial [Aquabacterium sp.]|nr:ATP-binding cassette domain-containing protein [Aquabacterium sp.]